jgi:hypothetical protein
MAWRSRAQHQGLADDLRKQTIAWLDAEAEACLARHRDLVSAADLHVLDHAPILTAFRSIVNGVATPGSAIRSGMCTGRAFWKNRTPWSDRKMAVTQGRRTGFRGMSLVASAMPWPTR